MSPINTYKHAIRLLIKPEQEWQAIACENNISPGKLLWILLIPVSAMLALSNFLGFYWFDNHPMQHIDMYLFSAVSSFVFSILSIYLSSLVVRSFAVYPSKKERFQKAFILIAFAYTPGFIFNSIAFLFPMVNYLSILGLYSFFVLYKGITPFLNVPDRRRTGYFTFILIGLLSLYAILGACFLGITSFFGF